MPCKYLKIRKKDYENYCFCVNKKQEISLQQCQDCKKKNTKSLRLKSHTKNIEEL